MIRSSRRRWLLFILLAGALLAGACAPVPAPAAPPSPPVAGHHFHATSGPVIASPVVADLDGDGSLEIAVGSWDGYFYVTGAGLQDRPGWPRFSPEGYFSSPSAADVDGDGRLELFVGSESGRLFGWNDDGSDLPGWPVHLRHRLWSAPTILPGSLVAILGAGQFFVLDSRGRPAKGWPRPAYGWGDSTAATDGKIVAVATLAEGMPDRGYLHAWTMGGQSLAGFPIRLAPRLGFFACARRPQWRRVERNHRRRRRRALARRGPASSAPPRVSAANGEPDRGLSCPWRPRRRRQRRDRGRLVDARLYAWDHLGRLAPGWPRPAQDQFISSAALADLDGDSLPDVVAGSKDHLLYAWNGLGVPLPGFPVDLGGYVFSSPWVGDLDGNGLADVVVGANNGIHVLNDIAPLGPVSWPKFHYDDGNTGYAGEIE